MRNHVSKPNPSFLSVYRDQKEDKNQNLEQKFPRNQIGEIETILRKKNQTEEQENI